MSCKASREVILADQELSICFNFLSRPIVYGKTSPMRTFEFSAKQTPQIWASHLTVNLSQYIPSIFTSKKINSKQVRHLVMVISLTKPKECINDFLINNYWIDSMGLIEFIIDILPQSNIYRENQDKTILKVSFRVLIYSYILLSICQSF